MQQNVRKFEPERPEIYVIWWNDGLLGYNVNVSDDQQPIQKFKWCNFLNKLSIVENTKKINKWKKLKQNVGPWWCVHVYKSYNCRLKQIQGSSQLEVVNSTGTCGQDPMLLPFFLFSFYYFFLWDVDPTPFFFSFFVFVWTSTFFHINNILQLSMYHCMTYIQ